MHPSISHRRRRRTRYATLATVAFLALLALPAAAMASGLSVKLHAPGHTMSVAKGKTWKYSVGVNHNGKKIAGKVRYQFVVPVLGVEYTQAWQKFKGGKYKGTLKPWTNKRTKLAEGITLTFRVTVDTSYGDKTINYKVKITK